MCETRSPCAEAGASKSSCPIKEAAEEIQSKSVDSIRLSGAGISFEPSLSDFAFWMEFEAGTSLFPKFIVEIVHHYI